MKLDLHEIIKSTFDIFIGNLGVFFKTAWAWICLNFICLYVFKIYMENEYLFGISIALMIAISGFSVAVVWHRSILLDEWP